MITGEPLTAGPAVDEARLAPIVARMLRAEVLSTGQRDCRLLTVDTPEPVFRLAGQAITSSGRAPWSVILKIGTAPVANGPVPTADGYPLREAGVYESDILQGAPGLCAPRCHRIDYHDGAPWLWLEDVAGSAPDAWPADRYAVTARHLGQFNAHWLGARSLPAYPWLGSGLHHNTVRHAANALERLLPRVSGPAFSAAFVPDTVNRLGRLLAEVEPLLTVLDAEPQTICHGDAHRGNLFVQARPDGGATTVAIDWACIGWGPAGLDLAKLLSAGVDGLGADALQERDGLVFDAYVQGLIDGGWRGSRKRVRRVYAAGAAGRLLARSAFAIECALTPADRDRFERVTGLPFETSAARFAEAMPYYLQLADEALARLP